jgi:hypothetical protein
LCRVTEGLRRLRLEWHGERLRRSSV